MVDLKTLQNLLEVGTERMEEYYKENPGLHTGQSPKIVVVGCSDSRVPTDILFNTKPGELFTFRNIGGSIENDEDSNQLSSDAKKLITYANHIKAETIVILAHGNCGCIANACSCANPSSSDDHGHGDHTGLEAKILKEMGDEKRFAVDLVKKDDVSTYLSGKGLSAAADQAANFSKSIEVAHGFHMAKLAKEQLKKLDSRMTVVVAYYDVANCETYLENDQGKLDKIVPQKKNCNEMTLSSLGTTFPNASHEVLSQPAGAKHECHCPNGCNGKGGHSAEHICQCGPEVGPGK